MSSSKPVLVTGSSGFVGRHLVRFLREEQVPVEEFDQAHGDISDQLFLYPELDHVFHLASQTYVPSSWERPLDFYRANVLGTANVLELCRRHSCSLTYVSSNVYGTPKYLPVDEKHPVRPSSPYSHSKLLAEEMCRYYAETFRIPVAVLRPVNIYGIGQRDDFLIPTILRQILDPETERIRVRDTRPKCDYLYVDDFVRALFCTMNIKGFEIYNIGSGSSISVEDIILTALRCAAVSKPYSSENSERKNEIWDVYVDVSKFRKQFGWNPEISFEDGLSRCVRA
jgi:nucleoside-diphosphate-sugar epimerase